MPLSKKEKDLILSGVQDWHLRPMSYYRRLFTPDEWAEYQKALWPFVKRLTNTNSAEKEEAKWEALAVFLRKKIKKGDI